MRTKKKKQGIEAR